MKLITTSADGTIRLWDLKKKSRLKTEDIEKLTSDQEKLEELANKACTWLKDYRATHPEQQQELPCQN